MNSGKKGDELILVINPGSTSTKTALFRGEEEISSVSIDHTAEELSQYDSVLAQKDLRKNAVLAYLEREGVKLTDLTAIAARCGAVTEMESGAYAVDEKLVRGAAESESPHPANLAPIIAYELCKEAQSMAERDGLNRTESDGMPKAFIYDGVSCCGVPDEIYKVSGIADFDKPFYTHVLNSRAVAIEQARRDGKIGQAESGGADISGTTYIVGHLGGGITVNLIKDGRVLDFVGDDEGTFSPERSGGLPVRRLVDLCYSGKYTREEMQMRLKGKGGLMSYLGTNDSREVEKRIEDGDGKARLVYDAMALQTAKDIASLAVVTAGDVDKIILTGGIAHSAAFTGKIKERVEFIAPVEIIPGTFEMQALAGGVLRVLRGEEEYHRLQ